jgi:hypothetical protein
MLVANYYKQDKVETGTIYLGPHGAPPSQLKLQDLNSSSAKKSKNKQKLKEADKKGYNVSREIKLEGIRDPTENKGYHQSPRGNQSG